MAAFHPRAAAMVQAGVAFAEAKGIRVAVVVLDAAFVPVALARIDGAFASTVGVATAKAHTALNFGAPTAALKERIAPENRAALAAVEPRLMFVGGGVPLLDGERVVGALGVSGASEDGDVECALAAAAAGGG